MSPQLHQTAMPWSNANASAPQPGTDVTHFRVRASSSRLAELPSAKEDSLALEAEIKAQIMKEYRPRR